MEPIAKHSLARAAEEAVTLWALACAQYPKQHGLILGVVRASVVEAASAFALNARRAIEALPEATNIPLGQPRWHWARTAEGELIADLRDALNRIIHARKLEVGFEELPSELSVIDGGAVVVPYIQAETDRRKLAFIDPFAMSHAFLYSAFPQLVAATTLQGGENIH